MLNPSGLCECGCGEKTTIAAKTNRRLGWVKGQPIRFVNGHHFREHDNHGSDSPSWKGGRTVTSQGYVHILKPNHLRSHSDTGYVSEHILVAERALGKPLPKGAVIHHVNGDPSDNRPGNLVICQSNGYHLMLHRRQRALAACGHVDWRKCPLCKQYDSPRRLYISHNGGSIWHRSCKREYDRQRYHRLRS